MSILPGDYYLTSIDNNYDTITNNIAKYFNQYTIKKYLVGTIYKPFKKILKKNNFEYWHSLISLLNDLDFIEISKKIPNSNTIKEQKNMMYDKNEKVNKNMDEDRNNISV